MKTTRKFGSVLLAMSLSATGSADAEPQLCQGLAALAEQIPAEDWLDSAIDPMGKLMHQGTPRRSDQALSAVERRLVSDPGLRNELSLGPEDLLGIERLEGSDIYRVDEARGSAHCQTMAFFEAPAGQPPRRLPAPFVADTCITRYGRFGHALGQAFFLVGGWDSAQGLSRSYRISAWQGGGKEWTSPCTLRLEFKQELKLTGRYCSPDAKLCSAAAGMAPAIAEAYVEATSHQSPLDPLAFASGREPPAAVLKLLSDPSSASPEFPTFGTKTQAAVDPFLTSFSNAQAPARLALWIDGRWWLGLVGTAGIGWRTSTTTLLVISAMTDAGLVPAASFQVEQFPVGRASASWQRESRHESTAPSSHIPR